MVREKTITSREDLYDELLLTKKIMIKTAKNYYP